MFTTRTWRTLAVRPEGDEFDLPKNNLCAALDRKNGWVYVGDRNGLHAWLLAKFESDSRFPQFTGPVSLVAVSESQQSLYTLENCTLRSWKLGE